MTAAEIQGERWRPIEEAVLSHAPRLVAIDIDHTLIRTDHTLAPATIEAVALARGRGVHVVLSSSRPPRAMWPYLRDLGLIFPEPFVSLQGALVGRYDVEGRLSADTTVAMRLESAKEVVRLASRQGLAVSWYRDEEWLVSGIDAGVEREARIVGMTPRLCDLELEEVAPQKLLLIDSSSEGAATGQVVPSLPDDLIATRSNPSYLELTGTGVDKGVAVSMVAADLGVDRDGIVAIGDGPNDLGMFAVAGVTVAPANAAEVVRGVARYRTRSNDDDGVAFALRTLLG